jgi:hypothetical protein
MQTKTLYTVYGTVGEYEDTHSWTVMAFEELDDARAMQRVLEAQAEQALVQFNALGLAKYETPNDDFKPVSDDTNFHMYFDTVPEYSIDKILLFVKKGG